MVRMYCAQSNLCEVTHIHKGDGLIQQIHCHVMNKMKTGEGEPDGQFLIEDLQPQDPVCRM